MKNISKRVSKNLEKTTAKQFKNMGIVFILIAIALIVVGKVTGDSLWYIRTIIFCSGALVAFWLGERKRKNLGKI